MIKFLFFIVMFIGISAGVFAQEFEVTGIIHQKQPVAIINGKIVKIGDEIDGAVVQRIVDNSVFLKYNGDIIIKNVSGKRLSLDVEEAVIDKKPLDEKSSKGSFAFFLFVLVLILAGGGFYLFGKRKRAPAE